MLNRGHYKTTWYCKHNIQYSLITVSFQRKTVLWFFCAFVFVIINPAAQDNEKPLVICTKIAQNNCLCRYNVNYTSKSYPFGMSLSYSRYYAEACDERRDPSPRLSAWTIKLRRNVAAVSNCWKHCVRFHRPGNRSQDLPHR